MTNIDIGLGEHTPGAKARILQEVKRPKTEALGYLQARTGKGKGNYGDSGFARMTTRATTRTKAGTDNSKNNSRFPSGMTNKGSELR